ncbi:MAG: glycerol-3-phosphate acyltransferase [Clostridia bacterium]|nr:glycerol-3-phosphate acyltransferase [Clostridia bacterium]
MSVILCGTMGYLIGMINPAYIFGRLRGFDIRRRGSGNAGATNVTLVMGKAMGLLCALLDIIKSFVAYKLAKRLFPMLVYAGILAGCACVLGHIFPAWMGFQGGKGLACLAGMVLAYDRQVFLIMLVLEVIFALAVNYICVIPISASMVFPVVYGIQTHDAVGVLLLFVLAPVIVYKHLPNLRRIRAGQEARLSWLWNAKAEEARLKEHIAEADWEKAYRKADQKDA